MSRFHWAVVLLCMVVPANAGGEPKSKLAPHQEIPVIDPIAPPPGAPRPIPRPDTQIFVPSMEVLKLDVVLPPTEPPPRTPPPAPAQQ